MFFAPLDSPPGAYPKPTSDVLYVACGWLILRRMSCMVQVALQINISRFAVSTEVLVLTYSLNPQTANINSDKPVLCYSDTQCKMSPRVKCVPPVLHMNDCVAKTHYSETTVKAPECLLKQQICHHCTNCHGDRVRSQTYRYYQCMSVCSLPFTATSRKKKEKKLSGRVTPPL